MTSRHLFRYVALCFGPAFSATAGESDGMSASAGDDQFWPGLSVPVPGANSSVFSLTVYNGQLIAGGRFLSIGGAGRGYCRTTGRAISPAS